MMIEIRFGWIYCFIGLWTYLAITIVRMPRSLKTLTVLGQIFGFGLCITVWPIVPMIVYFTDRIREKGLKCQT